MEKSQYSPYIPYIKRRIRTKFWFSANIAFLRNDIPTKNRKILLAAIHADSTKSFFIPYLIEYSLGKSLFSRAALRPCFKKMSIPKKASRIISWKRGSVKR